MTNETLSGLLPLLALASLMRASRRPGGPWLDAVVPGAIVWALVAVASAEGLGLFHAIDRGALIACWSATIVAAALVARRRRRVAEPPTSRPPGESGATVWALGLIAGAAVVSVIALGLLAPPNTWDAMTYHLARVAHWRQAGSLAHYPTPITRQLVSGPLAEILILHFQVLSRGDGFANLVQGLALAGCAVGAALAARRLGVGGRGQALAALFVATLPIAVLEGSGGQNDLVVSFFLIAGAERLLAWRAEGRSLDGLAAGAALGLAVLAKGTAWFFGAGLALIVPAVLVSRRRWRDLGVAAAMAALVIVINAGPFARNLLEFGTPLGPQFGVASLDRSLGGLASNLARGVASNLATPFAPVNEALVRVIAFGHKVLGGDVDAPDTTFPATRFGLSRSVLDENLAPNPLHLLLVALAIGGALRALARGRAGAPLLYVAAVVVGGLLFCLLLRWQPWITRLQLPFFVLMAPAVGWLLSAGLPRARPLAWGAVLTLAALPWLVANQVRPWYAEPVRPFASRVAPNIVDADRWTLMFWVRPALLPAYRDAVARVADRARADGLGLVMNEDSWEYPVWALLNGDGRAPARIEHVCGASDPAGFRPAALLVIERPAPPELTCGGVTYVREATIPTPGDWVGEAGVSIYGYK